MKLNTYLTNPKLVFALIGAVVLALVIFFKTASPPPQVLETSPASQADNVLDSAPIVIQFNRDLSPKEQPKVSVTISPATQLSPEWLSPSQIKLNHLAPLLVKTVYTAQVTYKDKPIYQFSFTTNQFSSAELQKQIQEQSADDLLFAQTEKDFYTKYPWQAKLPIETSEFRIVYDWERSAFRIRILKPNPSPEDISRIKSVALSRLVDIGIDTAKQNQYFIDTNNKPL